MAKANDSKSELKKLHREIIVLRKKLKTAEKASKAAEKNWKKKHSDHAKEVEQRIATAHQKGYQQALAENQKKEVARKKVLKSADALFEKDYRHKPTKSKASKKTSSVGVKTKSKKAKAKKAKTAKKTVSASKVSKMSKASKPVRKTKKAKSISGSRASAKRRGRPVKQSKQERALDGHQLSHHGEVSHLHHDQG